MSEYDDALITEAVNNVSPRMGGKKLRGPNATFDFIQAVWCEKAILQTRQLPSMLEIERQNYLKQIKLLDDVGTKGKYTNSSGWSPTREYKIQFSISRPTYHYFANVIGPFLGYDKQIWADGSRMWRFIKKLIMSGDKVRISKFAKDIEKKLFKERGKKILGGINGTEAQSSSSIKNITENNIQ